MASSTTILTPAEGAIKQAQSYLTERYSDVHIDLTPDERKQVEEGNPAACRVLCVRFYLRCGKPGAPNYLPFLQAAITLGWLDGQFDFQYYSESYTRQHRDSVQVTPEQYVKQAKALLTPKASPVDKVKAAFYFHKAAKLLTPEKSEMLVCCWENTIRCMIEAGANSKFLIDDLYGQIDVSLKKLLSHSHLTRIKFAFLLCVRNKPKHSLNQGYILNWNTVYKLGVVPNISLLEAEEQGLDSTVALILAAGESRRLDTETKSVAIPVATAITTTTTTIVTTAITPSTVEVKANDEMIASFTAAVTREDAKMVQLIMFHLDPGYVAQFLVAESKGSSELLLQGLSDMRSKQQAKLDLIFCELVRIGDVKAVRDFMPYASNISNLNGFIPVNEAAKSGNTALVRLLWKAGADISNAEKSCSHSTHPAARFLQKRNKIPTNTEAEVIDALTTRGFMSSNTMADLGKLYSQAPGAVVRSTGSRRGP